jgi:hypothetical protein
VTYRPILQLVVNNLGRFYRCELVAAPTAFAILLSSLRTLRGRLPAALRTHRRVRRKVQRPRVEGRRFLVVNGRRARWRGFVVALERLGPGWPEGESCAAVATLRPSRRIPTHTVIRPLQNLTVLTAARRTGRSVASIEYSTHRHLLFTDPSIRFNLAAATHWRWRLCLGNPLFSRWLLL